jgi:hypothetical protein
MPDNVSAFWASPPDSLHPRPVVAEALGVSAAKLVAFPRRNWSATRGCAKASLSCASGGKFATVSVLQLWLHMWLHIRKPRRNCIGCRRARGAVLELGAGGHM